MTGSSRQGGQAIAVTGDVTRLADLEANRRQIEDELGLLDIVVANAGGSFTPPALLEEIPEDGWRASVEGNLTATFLTLKCVIPGMKQRGSGAIVTMSSSAGRRPNPRSPIPYAAAKAALELLTQDVAAQVGPFGIRVNCIAPETILTERNKQRIPEALQAQMVETHPVRRLGTPEDVAQRGSVPRVGGDVVDHRCNPGRRRRGDDGALITVSRPGGHRYPRTDGIGLSHRSSGAGRRRGEGHGRDGSFP